MTVLNVLSTNAVAASATEYQVVQTGFYRVIANAGDATVAFNDGPAITLIDNESILVKGGKPGQAKVVKATNAATAVYTLGNNLQEHMSRDTHPFSVGDFIAVVNDGTDPAINSGFLSAGTAGKSISAATGATITTDIDASSVGSAYTYASGKQAIVKRCTKIAVTGNAIVVEEVQVVGG